MLRTYEATLQHNGILQFIDASPKLPLGSQRVLVIVEEDEPAPDTALCGATLSEPALANDWLREEEAAAWAHLQADK